MQDTEETPRSIRFPKTLWQALDTDAKRCKRSSVKQLEALLTTYYEIGNVEINKEKLKQTGEKVPAKTETNNAVIVGTPKFPELEAVKPKKKRVG